MQEDRYSKLSSNRFNFHCIGYRCCPASFSSYVLQAGRKTSITGLGISLPIKAGGHPYELEEHLRKRYKMHFADITKYWLGPEVMPGSDTSSRAFTSLPSQVHSGGFGLVIVDGHFLGPSESSARWDVDRLLIAQIIIALESVLRGGSIIVKLKRIDRMRTAQILYMLDILSSSLTTVKPQKMWAKRSSFYAVAKGVGLGRQGDSLSEILLELKRVWHDMTFGGDEGRGRFMELVDLDFLIGAEDLRQGRDGILDRLVAWGKEVNQCQIDALEKLIGKHRKPCSVNIISR